MSNRDDFDVTIDTLHKARNVPVHLIDAAVYLRDALEIAKLAAERTFGEDVPPALVLEVYDRLNAERLRRVETDEPKGRP